jgi:hypothetical protein
MQLNVPRPKKCPKLDRAEKQGTRTAGHMDDKPKLIAKQRIAKSFISIAKKI